MPNISQKINFYIRDISRHEELTNNLCLHRFAGKTY